MNLILVLEKILNMLVFFYFCVCTCPKEPWSKWNAWTLKHSLFSCFLWKNLDEDSCLTLSIRHLELSSTTNCEQHQFWHNNSVQVEWRLWDFDTVSFNCECVYFFFYEWWKNLPIICNKRVTWQWGRVWLQCCSAGVNIQCKGRVQRALHAGLQKHCFPLLVRQGITHRGTTI